MIWGNKKMKKKMNKWKVAFLTLFGILLVGIIALAALIFMPVEDDRIPTANEKISGSEVRIQATAKDFENLANQFIYDATEGTTMPTKMYVDQSSITIVSRVDALGMSVPVTMEFDPTVDANGNLLLHQTSIGVGMLDIPTSTALKLVKNSGKLPNFISIQPSKEQAYIDLNAINIPITDQTTAHLAATKFDLAKDDIELTVTLPAR